METQHELGRRGEDIAAAHLRNNNYTILHRNWRFAKDEIDIVAMDGDELVIVEVKTRSTNYFGEPEFAVAKRKQGFLIRAANEYVYKFDFKGEIRFDIVSIILNQYSQQIELIKNAFYPTL